MLVSYDVYPTRFTVKGVELAVFVMVFVVKLLLGLLDSCPFVPIPI